VKRRESVPGSLAFRLRDGVLEIINLFGDFPDPCAL